MGKEELSGGEYAAIFDIPESPEYKKVGDRAILVDGSKVDDGWTIKGFNGETGDVILEKTFRPQARGERFRTEQRVVAQSDFERTNFPGSELLVKYFFDELQSLNEMCATFKIRDGVCVGAEEVPEIAEKKVSLNDSLRAFAKGDLRLMHKYLLARIKKEEDYYNILLKRERELNENLLTKIKRSLGSRDTHNPPEVDLIMEELRRTQKDIKRADSDKSDFSKLERLINILNVEMEKRGQITES